jgi:uncharacterized ferritin-like protein (DUF455 family)
MTRIALIQVLGAVAYGEWKAHDKAKVRAAEATDEDERRAWRRVAAEELRHHKGFVGRLEALGADPDRAMRPYRASLDRYHALEPHDEVERAVWSYLGEGVADDLLQWLRRVTDSETSEFIDTVIADEENHEAMATAELRRLLAGERERRKAERAARRMALHMLDSGKGSPLIFAAFLRLGRPHELVGAILGGHTRRMHAIGLGPLGLPRLVRPAP